jgi:hypothetical protein
MPGCALDVLQTRAIVQSRGNKRRPHRPEERPVSILTVPCNCEVVPNTLCGLRVNGQPPFLPPLRTARNASYPQLT